MRKHEIKHTAKQIMKIKYMPHLMQGIICKTYLKMIISKIQKEKLQLNNCQKSIQINSLFKEDIDIGNRHRKKLS